MLPFEFIVQGIPVSHQTKNRAALRNWKIKVEAEARKRWPTSSKPTIKNVKITITYYRLEALDVDNMVKPIQDALKQLVYVDDNQVTDCYSKKRNLKSSYRNKNISSALMVGLIDGREFVHVKVEIATDQ